MSFRDQETGKRNQESCDTDHAYMQRVRWRSRRGLLELDILLGRFIDTEYVKLDEAGRQAFEVFLDMADNPFWDMVSGMKEAETGELQALLEKIRAV